MSDVDNDSDVMDEWAEALEESGDTGGNDASGNDTSGTAMDTQAVNGNW